MRLSYLSLVFATLLLISTLYANACLLDYRDEYINEHSRHSVGSNSFIKDSLSGVIKRNLASNYPSYSTSKSSNSRPQYQSYPGRTQQRSSPSASTAPKRVESSSPAPQNTPTQPMNYLSNDSQVPKASTSPFSQKDVGNRLSIDESKFDDCV